MKSQDKYAYRSTITIDGCSIEELKAAKREFSFIIRDHEKRDRKFVAKTDEKRSFWLRILREAIDRCSNPELFDDGHHFQMKTFDETNARCDSCARYLCGIFFQGYECTRCRKKVHRDCVKKIGTCPCRPSIERIRSFDRGPIEFSHNFGAGVSSTNNQSRVYALYDYDGAARTSRTSDRHIRVNEGDELEIIEDDDEQIWKVKNLRTNEIGLIPATMIGTLDGESPKVAERTSVNSTEISSMRSNIPMTLVQHFPFIRSLVEAYSSSMFSQQPYSQSYSSAVSPNSNHPSSTIATTASNVPIQRSKSISSPTTPEHILYRHRSLQLSSSFDNKRSSSAKFHGGSTHSGFFDWYLDISRHQAEEILRTDGIPNNTFLVRKQGKNEGHAISIKHNNEVYHIRIFTQEVEGIPKYYLVDGLHFESLQALIQYYQIHSLEDRFPPVKSSLVYPIAQVFGHDTLIQPDTF